MLQDTPRQRLASSQLTGPTESLASWKNANGTLYTTLHDRARQQSRGVCHLCAGAAVTPVRYHNALHCLRNIHLHALLAAMFYHLAHLHGSAQVYLRVPTVLQSNPANQDSQTLVAQNGSLFEIDSFVAARCWVSLHVKSTAA